jgi:hypothetical protein
MFGSYRAGSFALAWISAMNDILLSGNLGKRGWDIRNHLIVCTTSSPTGVA